jgi:two-component system, NtrC family, C4-dicarboxylate transport sensor histidine kinase DctB
MRDASSRRPSELRLVAYIALGAAAGLVYVVFDVLSEAKIRSGTLTGPLAGAHDIVDHTFPVLVGILLGVGAHYLRLRAQLFAAEEAAGRAEALRVRLQKVERDQAVWVLAAAILHEVNNPLHALGLLLDELPACAARDDARRDDLIARARAQAERALSQLRLLRSVGGVGEPELQRIARDRVVGALADDVGSLAREDGLSVRLECERPVRASADPAYVRTILENLLDNSLHSLRGRLDAAQGGGSITIHLGVEDGRAVVRVRDDGPPLDPGVRATLFEPLRTTKAHGLGLGLPIARALARAMRGDLALDEGDGHKSFRLELPLGDGPP